MRAVLRTAFLLCGLTAMSSAAAATVCTLSDEDRQSVRRALEAYVAAWLDGNAEAVMATLADDVVMIPHHGDTPKAGKAAVRAWWFPPGAPTTAITRYETPVTDISGCGDMAVAYGRSTLIFEYDGTRYSNAGNWLTVLRRGEDGRWRMTRRIWNDPPAETD